MLDSLMIAGYIEETRAFRDWLLRTVAGDPANMQIMYSIAGARRLPEYELGWLPGYEGSRPVRVGNAASGQFPLRRSQAGSRSARRGLADARRDPDLPRGRVAPSRRKHLGGSRRPAAISRTRRSWRGSRSIAR
jgi:hypothetical protein